MSKRSHILIYLLIVANITWEMQVNYNENIEQDQEQKVCTGQNMQISIDQNKFSNTGGWDPNPIHDFLLKVNDITMIERRESAQNFESVAKDYDFPIIWSANPMRNHLKQFLPLVDKQKLICQWGEKKIQLSNSVTYSYGRKYVTFAESVEMMEKEKNLSLQELLDMNADTTWYNFGGNQWKFVDDFYIPPQGKGQNGENTPTFGIGRTGTGVPFHFHGPVYLELIYGQKIWFFAPPDKKPNFNPDESTFKWFYENKHQQDGVLTVVQKPGEIVYIPNKWWHGTLNIGETVFIASFA